MTVSRVERGVRAGVYSMKDQSLLLDKNGTDYESFPDDGLSDYFAAKQMPYILRMVVTFGASR